MPELPEVETIVRGLNRAITGKKLSRFLVFDKERLARPRLPLPQKIKSVQRHGKYIVCEAEKGRCIIHLRMTGELLLKKRSPAPSRQAGLVRGQQSKNEYRKHERARFHFRDGSILHFVDVRRFGTIEWSGANEPLPQLGLEPLSRDFSAASLAKVLRGKTQAVKSTLLDQKKIAGIGNIYADEALWAAKIHPKRRAGDLSVREVGALVHAVRGVLRRAIKMGGFTLRDYRHIDGHLGEYQNSRKVYDREDKPCLRCSVKIERIKLIGRSSYFCPKCQRAK